jgi:hypothetical protein
MSVYEQILIIEQLLIEKKFDEAIMKLKEIKFENKKTKVKEGEIHYCEFIASRGKNKDKNCLKKNGERTNGTMFVEKYGEFRCSKHSNLPGKFHLKKNNNKKEIILKPLNNDIIEIIGKNTKKRKKSTDKDGIT